MQPLILIYDIEHDRKRAKIADTCRDYGLDRIQHSSFVGRLSRNHAEALIMDIEQILDGGRGNVQLIQLSEKDWNNRMEINHAG
ncbi:MAG: CRISPR-associated endonuclease Cas2 [Phototrophicaceae bacterium]